VSELAEKLGGKFIVLDGPDGAGKSTQLGLLEDHLAAIGVPVQTVHDPGCTDVGQKIRDILLQRDHHSMAPMCETMLFMASRAQLVVERIKPALEAGKLVLSDRYVSATVAYQGASGVDPEIIIKMGDIAVQGIWPDLTVILDVDVELGMQRVGAPRQRVKKGAQTRLSQRSLFGDRLEAVDLSYHDQVREIFTRLSDCYPRPVAHVDANRDVQAVFRDVLAALEKAFGG